MPVKRTALVVSVSMAAGFVAGALALPLLGPLWARVPALTVMLAASTSMTHSRARAIRMLPGSIAFLASVAIVASRPLGAFSVGVMAAGSLALAAVAARAIGTSRAR